MADIKSPEERSNNMAKIRSKDTKPEVWFRKKLFAKGYRYRKNVNSLPGHPDLWLAIRQYSSMVVSGIGIKTVNTHIFPKAELNSGMRNFRRIKSGMLL